MKTKIQGFSSSIIITVISAFFAVFAISELNHGENIFIVFFGLSFFAAFGAGMIIFDLMKEIKKRKRTKTVLTILLCTLFWIGCFLLIKYLFPN